MDRVRGKGSGNNCGLHFTENGRGALKLLVLGAILAGCGPTVPHRILLVGPFTGPNSSLGVDGLKGAQLAVQEWNDRGGLQGSPVEITVLDDENDPEKSLDLLQKSSWEGVLGVILHTTSSASMKAVPYLNSRGVITFSRTVSTPAWSGMDDFFVRFAGNTEHFGRELGKMILAEGRTDIALAYETGNKTYADAIVRGLTKEFPELNLRTPSGFETWENFESSGGDEGILTPLPDALVLIASGLNCAKAAQNLSRRKLNIPLFVSPWAHNQVLADYAGDYAPQIHILGTSDPGSQNPKYLAFLKSYEDFYGLKPTNFALFGYEVADFFLSTAAEAQDLTATAIKKRILNQGSVQGLQDRIDLDSYGDASYTTFQIGIKDGSFYRKN